MYNFTYMDIINSPDNYDLNSSISLKIANGSILPYWITENFTEYSSNISTLFNPSNDTSLNVYFQVKDYWGDIVYSNTFRITVLPNSPPYIVEKLNNVTFYKGQIAGIILSII